MVNISFSCRHLPKCSVRRFLKRTIRTARNQSNTFWPEDVTPQMPSGGQHYHPVLNIKPITSSLPFNPLSLGFLRNKFILPKSARLSLPMNAYSGGQNMLPVVCRLKYAVFWCFTSKPCCYYPMCFGQTIRCPFRARQSVLHR